MVIGNVAMTSRFHDVSHDISRTAAAVKYHGRPRGLNALGSLFDDASLRKARPISLPGHCSTPDE